MHKITISDVYRLLVALKHEIGDDYRADEDSETPSMSVTFGADEDGWNYQTGDNSFTGGAYGYRDWATVTLTRRSNCRDLARDVVSQFRDGVA